MNIYRDTHGYYARSTDEEIIEYLDGYYQQIRPIKEKREEKLKKINAINNNRQ